MKVSPNIFRGYDLRGLVGKELSPELAEHLGKGFGTMLAKDGVKKAVVSYDSRETSPQYCENVIKGLRWAGIDVFNIGMQMVGMFYWAQYELDCQGGIYVSASHNPPQFNGFKFANDYSETLVSENLQELRKIVESESYQQGESEGSLEKVDIRQDYHDDLNSRLKVAKSIKVLVDSSNTVSGEIIPELLRQAGCEVIERNTKVDSTFPLGVADPTETVVAERLSTGVKETGADVGFTYDADGDRIGVVDEKGGIIWNDVIVALLAADVLHDHPGAKIMFNTLCSRVVPETIKNSGGKPFMWRTGHSFLKKKNQEVKAAFIGELSGHFFFSADFYNHDDGAYSTLRLLQYLSRSGKKLSEIVAGLPQYISSPEIKVECPDDKKVEVVTKIAPRLREDFPEAEVVDDERAGDGVRLDMADSMFVVRYSQNGPYLTVKFEAKDQEKYDELKNYIAKLLKDYPEINWESDISVNTEALD